jgi:hypothetical protein
MSDAGALGNCSTVEERPKQPMPEAVGTGP